MIDGVSFDLTGRVALVTGASRGIGKALARGLAQAGADVVLASRDEQALRAARDEVVDGTGRRGTCIAADLSLRSEADRVAREAVAEHGRVDILVNNAGQNVPQAIEDVTDPAWDEVLAVHLSSAMALTRALAPGMKKRGWGRIVYLSSIMGFQGMARRNAYATAKTAVRGLARSNAIELGPHGVTVNCLAPGAIHTDALSRLTPEERERIVERIPLARLAEPDELVGPLLMLVSDAGRYVTGTTVVVDGGWLAQ